MFSYGPRSKSADLPELLRKTYLPDVTVPNRADYESPVQKTLRSIRRIGNRIFSHMRCERNISTAGKDLIMNGKLLTGYAGTYSSGGEGIYRFSFDPVSGTLSEPELFYRLRDAKWVSLRQNFLAAACEKGGRAGTCLIELKDGVPVFAGEVLEEQSAPCFILQDEEHIYTANYHDGTVMVYSRDGGRLNPVRRIETAPKAGCHQILLHGRYLVVPCLTRHTILLFNRGRSFSPAGEIPFPDGSGPRHGVFNREHTRLYVVSEWSNELFVFQVLNNQADSEFRLIGQNSVLRSAENDRFGLSGQYSPCSADAPAAAHPSGCEPPASAAIRLSRDERYLYISIRGVNQIAVFRTTGTGAVPVRHSPCGGEHPRDFILSGDERYLLAANRMTNDIVCMERNPETGMLSDPVSRISIPQCISLTGI